MGQAAVMVPRLDSRICCRPVARPDAPASFAWGLNPSATRSLAYPGPPGKTNYRLTLGRDFNPVMFLEREYQDRCKVAPGPSTRPHDDVDGNLELAGAGMVGLEDDLVIDEAGGCSGRHGHGQAVSSLEGRRACKHKLELGLLGVVGLDDQLLAESPQGHAGLELQVDPVPPLGLEILEFLGREGNRLGDDLIRLRCTELLDL